MLCVYTGLHYLGIPHRNLYFFFAMFAIETAKNFIITFLSWELIPEELDGREMGVVIL